MSPEYFTSVETLKIEFKEDRDDWSDQRLAESVVAMTNAEGGEIFLGIKNDGQIVGSQRLRSGRWTKCESEVPGIILSYTQPAVSVEAECVLMNRFNVIKIVVPKGTTVVGTKQGKYLRRTYDAKGRPQNLPMSPDEILSSISRVGTMDFSSTTLMGANLIDVDLEIVQQTAQKVLSITIDDREKTVFQQSPIDILKSLALLDHDNKPNVACILLFGKPQSIRARISNHFVQCQAFGPSNEVLENQTLSDPLATLFPKILELPRLKRNSDELRINGSNIVIPEYSADSIRESFANALVHRDYTLHSGIQIQMHERELIVVNPGSFPTGVSFQNLLSVPPTPRNRRLAEAMARLRFVENSGRGVDFIFKGQAMYGRPAPDYTQSDANRVFVRLVGGKANLDFCRFILSSAKETTAHEMLLLNAMFLKGYLLLGEAAKTIQQPPSIASEILFTLNRKGLVEISPEDTPRYFIKPSIHHTTRRLVNPVRIKKADIDRYKKSIISELNRRSPLTTNDVADAVGLSATQTYRLLCRLKTERKIGLSHGLTGKRWQLANRHAGDEPS